MGSRDRGWSTSFRKMLIVPTKQPTAMVMARVHRQSIRERDAYEFFHKLNEQREPVFVKDIEQRGAIFSHRGNCYRSGLTYNAGLKRYLWCQTLPASTDSRGPRFEGGFGIYDASGAVGPMDDRVLYTPLGCRSGRDE